VWYWSNHGGPKGRKPPWPEVVFWIAVLGVADVGIVLTLPTDLPGRIFLVAVSIVGWAWFFTSPARKRRRESRRAMDDQPQCVTPPQGGDP
jgi:hypothetical protein